MNEPALFDENDENGFNDDRSSIASAPTKPMHNRSNTRISTGSKTLNPHNNQETLEDMSNTIRRNRRNTVAAGTTSQASANRRARFQSTKNSGWSARGGPFSLRRLSAQAESLSNRVFGLDGGGFDRRGGSYSGGHGRDGRGAGSEHSAATTRSVLKERLQEMVVFILYEDGRREYRTITLRELYAYVMKAITSSRSMRGRLPSNVPSMPSRRVRGVSDSSVSSMGGSDSTMPNPNRSHHAMHSGYTTDASSIPSTNTTSHVSSSSSPAAKGSPPSSERRAAPMFPGGRSQRDLQQSTPTLHNSVQNYRRSSTDGAVENPPFPPPPPLSSSRSTTPVDVALGSNAETKSPTATATSKPTNKPAASAAEGKKQEEGGGGGGGTFIPLKMPSSPQGLSTAAKGKSGGTKEQQEEETPPTTSSTSSTQPIRPTTTSTGTEAEPSPRAKVAATTTTTTSVTAATKTTTTTPPPSAEAKAQAMERKSILLTSTVLTDFPNVDFSSAKKARKVPSNSGGGSGSGGMVAPSRGRRSVSFAEDSFVTASGDNSSTTSVPVSCELQTVMEKSSQTSVAKDGDGPSPVVEEKTTITTKEVKPGNTSLPYERSGMTSVASSMASVDEAVVAAAIAAFRAATGPQPHYPHPHHASHGTTYHSVGGTSSTSSSSSASATSHFPPQPPAGHPQQQLPISYRERLGGYLHPRDMRRLVTPFSSTNQPELIVRRHVMLLNFDPLRAIVLRDRLMVLVPDGADSILIQLEKRLRGGLAELENEVFGELKQQKTNGKQQQGKHSGGSSGNGGGGGASTGMGTSSRKKSALNLLRRGSHEDTSNSSANHAGGGTERSRKKRRREPTAAEPSDENETVDTDSDESESNLDEWDDIDRRTFIDMPFELRAVDVVLETVVLMLLDDAVHITHQVNETMAALRGEKRKSWLENGAYSVSSTAGGEHTQERLRIFKDKVKEMEGRVKGFERALTQVLNEDEDMALMNLSRLLTHPERFVMPVSADILNEESDEPELILEAYLQQALSAMNAMDLLKGQIDTTEELVSMKLDTVRNRLLYINTYISIVTLCISAGSLVGSIFGMNLVNHLEDDPNVFGIVVTGTMVGTFVIFIIMWLCFRRANQWML